MQIKMTTMALAIASALLAACGQSGVSGGVEQTAAQEVGSKADASASQSVQNGKSSRVSTEAAGAMAVANVSRELAELAGIDVAAYEENVKFGGSPILPIESYLRAKHAKGSSADAVKARAALDLERFAAVPKTDVAARHMADLLIVCAEAISADPTAWDCYRDQYTRVFAAVAVQAGLTPRVQPGLPGEVVDGFDKTRRFPKAQFTHFASAVTTLSELSVELQPQWLKGIAGPMLRTLEDQQLHLVRQIAATPVAQVQQLAEMVPVPDAYALPGDAGSPLRIAVPSRGWVIAQDDKGLSIFQNGSLYHGDGLLAGGKVLLGVDSTAAANTEIRASAGTDSSSKVTGSNKVGANIQ